MHDTQGEPRRTNKLMTIEADAVFKLELED